MNRKNRLYTYRKDDGDFVVINGLQETSLFEAIERLAELGLLQKPLLCLDVDGIIYMPEADAVEVCKFLNERSRA
jgi:hypothetical protein